MEERDFAIRLATLRTKAGVSARDMSLSIGQNPGYINDIESGKGTPSLAGIIYICEFFKITPSEFFDFDSTTPVAMNSVEDLLSILPVGGGGTDFYSIFSSLKNELPSCIIVFTDGEGYFPPESIAMGVPVLWIINNDDITPPWGKTVRLIS